MIQTTTTTNAETKPKSHTFTLRLLFWMEKEIVPSFMTIMLVDPRFRDDIEEKVIRSI